MQASCVKNFSQKIKENTAVILQGKEEVKTIQKAQYIHTSRFIR